LGALLPDIDKPDSKIGSSFGIISKLIKGVFGHRGVIHTFWGMLVICGLFWLFASRQYGAALFIGFFSHLIIDGFTKKGVNILHPFSRFRIAGPFETGKIGEFILFVLIIVLIVLMLF
jgi:inner membrane protein